MTATPRVLPNGWQIRSVDGGGVLVVPPQPDLDGVLTHPVGLRAAARAKEGEPVVEIVGSAQTVDSFDTVFVQSGGDFRRYSANPVFLRQHDADELPLGTAVDWRTENIAVRVRGSRKRVEVPATVFSIRFDVADDPKNDDPWQSVSRAYLERYRRGVIRGASIGFRVPIVDGKRKDSVVFGHEMTEPERAEFGISEMGAVFKRWELVELSAVSVPANEHALATGRSISCTRQEFDALRAEIESLRRQVADRPPSSAAATKSNEVAVTTPATEAAPTRASGDADEVGRLAAALSTIGRRRAQ